MIRLPRRSRMTLDTNHRTPHASARESIHNCLVLGWMHTKKPITHMTMPINRLPNEMLHLRALLCRQGRPIPVTASPIADGYTSLLWFVDIGAMSHTPRRPSGLISTSDGRRNGCSSALPALPRQPSTSCSQAESSRPHSWGSCSPCSAYQDPPVRYREGRIAGGPSQVAPRTHASLRRTPLLPDPGMEQTYAPRLEEYVKKGGVSLQARGCHGHVNNSSCSATHRASIRSSLSRIKNAGSVLLAQNGN